MALSKATWQSWQRSYEHGMLAIWPPDVDRQYINTLRATHDPVSHRICEAHVLSGDEVDEVSLSRLQSEVDAVSGRTSPDKLCGQWGASEFKSSGANEDANETLLPPNE